MSFRYLRKKALFRIVASIRLSVLRTARNIYIYHHQCKKEKQLHKEAMFPLSINKCTLPKCRQFFRLGNANSKMTSQHLPSEPRGTEKKRPVGTLAGEEGNLPREAFFCAMKSAPAPKATHQKNAAAAPHSKTQHLGVRQKKSDQRGPKKEEGQNQGGDQNPASPPVKKPSSLGTLG